METVGSETEAYAIADTMAVRSLFITLNLAYKFDGKIEANDVW